MIPLEANPDAYLSGWRAVELTLPPEVYGVPTHSRGMAQPWGRFALNFVPKDQRPLCWIGRGTCVVSWGGTINFTGEMTQAARIYREWARKVHLEEKSRELLVSLGAFNFTDLVGTLRVPTLALIGMPHLRTFLIWHTSRDEEAQKLQDCIYSSNLNTLFSSDSPTPLRWEENGASIPLETWQNNLTHGTDLLRAGKAKKIVLSRDVYWSCSPPKQIVEVLKNLIAKDDHVGQDTSSWAFSIDNLVGASPEVLSQVTDGIFSARILAGTRPAGRGEELFDDPKELAEHTAARDSVLTKLASANITRVKTGEPRLLRLSNVDHLQTELSGRVTPGSDSATLATHFHPTAAICGTPTNLARELISQLELIDRGKFTGPVGLMHPSGDGQWNIALRCAQTEDATSPFSSQWRLLAGAGIMPSSTAARETEETGVKMGLMRKALGI
ncbi:chorismate-binding protein [Actinomycetaceae bacterium TAE3-ERU4]|nr:chorismate-binding protein [Actinomycetaceae bacterium TAE3-ERU4]